MTELLTFGRARTLLDKLSAQTQMHAFWFYAKITRGDSVEPAYMHNGVRVMAALKNVGKTEALKKRASDELFRLFSTEGPHGSPTPTPQAPSARKSPEAPQGSVSKMV